MPVRVYFIFMEVMDFDLVTERDSTRTNTEDGERILLIELENIYIQVSVLEYELEDFKC